MNDEPLELLDNDKTEKDFSFYENDEFINLTKIPVMSNEGQEGEGFDNLSAGGNNELKEDEHEDMVLDRGNEYKMVSIMRQA